MICSKSQSGFQSELKTVPLVAVIAGLSNFLDQFQARRRT